VNFEVMELRARRACQVWFKSITHAKFFNIVLVDFLSALTRGGSWNRPVLIGRCADCEAPLSTWALCLTLAQRRQEICALAKH